MSVLSVPNSAIPGKNTLLKENNSKKGGYHSTDNTDTRENSDLPIVVTDPLQISEARPISYSPSPNSPNSLLYFKSLSKRRL